MKNIILFFVITLATWSVKAQIVNIPDAYFKNILLIIDAKDLNGNWTIVDTNQDGEIQNSEAENILELNVSSKRIYDLTGIEAFVNLTKLNCLKNNLTSINLSTLTHLKEINCSKNNITELNVANNLQLEILKCYSNQITSLNVDSNTSLKILSCYSNSISNLNVSNNALLTKLLCNNNNIGTLDVSNNVSLVFFTCSGNNEISSLNVASNPLLEILNFDSTNITEIDISNNTQLKNLGFGNTSISNIDFSTNPLITALTFSNTNISTIDISNLLELKTLHFQNANISTINLSTNTKIKSLYCSGTNITSLDLSNNIELWSLQCNNLDINHLDLTNNINLEFLELASTGITQFTDVIGLTRGIISIRCNSNNFTELDLSNYVNLNYLSCNNNNITTLDLSNNINLRALSCKGNNNLSYINLKNGNNSNIYLYNSVITNFTNLPRLETVCVDEINTELDTKILNDTGHSVTFTEYCSFLAAQSNQVYGNVKFDMDNNGCDSMDLSMPNIMLITNNDTETFATFTQNDGSYLLYTNDGNFTTEVTTNLPSYFTVNPNAHVNNFIGFGNTYTADFCIEPNQTVNDLNITLLPISVARPNLEAAYTLVYKNIGTTVLDGNINLTFNDNLLDFVSASESVSSQITNVISFDYSNLKPFETRKITVFFRVSIDATINDNLDFTTTVYPILNDNTENDNTFVLNQTIVNSYDPNDIHILEGSNIKIQDTDNYLHYLIRFQNTGTAEAIHIVVTNELEAKLDWSTLQLEDTSHAARVTINNGNKVRFIFENINLPDKATNEKASQGYIAYKIKFKNSVSAGDVITNQANIFFDYNAAIETNVATIKITDNLASVSDTKLTNAILVYPNPIEENINIKVKNTKIVTVAIYSKLGQLIISKSNDNIEKINVSKLTKGVYFIKLLDNKGNSAIKKFIKD